MKKNSRTFQGKVNFQGIFKTVLYIQELFMSVRTLDIIKTEAELKKHTHVKIFNKREETYTDWHADITREIPTQHSSCIYRKEKRCGLIDIHKLTA